MPGGIITQCDPDIRVACTRPLPRPHTKVRGDNKRAILIKARKKPHASGISHARHTKEQESNKHSLLPRALLHVTHSRTRPPTNKHLVSAGMAPSSGNTSRDSFMYAFAELIISTFDSSSPETKKKKKNSKDKKAESSGDQIMVTSLLPLTRALAKSPRARARARPPYLRQSATPPPNLETARKPAQKPSYMSRTLGSADAFRCRFAGRGDWRRKAENDRVDRQQAGKRTNDLRHYSRGACQRDGRTLD